MKFWQSLAFVEMEQIVALAKHCEQAGFYGVSMADHLVTTKQQSEAYLYTKDSKLFWNPSTHWPDPWVMAAALSQSTQQLKFLSTVFILPLRDPFSVAKSVSTAAFVSGNRIVMGVGVGWQKTEFELTGENFHNRGKRCDEQLRIFKQLTTGQCTEFKGNHYSFEPLTMSPGTTEPIPIMVGGYSDAAMRRAAQHDGWLALSHSEHEIYPLIEKLQHIRRDIGKADKPFEIWTGVKNPEPGTHKRLAQAGVTMVNGTHFLGVDGRTTTSSIDNKKKRIDAFCSQFLN
jgi:probable F420-dependent oxidoreductase